MRWEDQDEIARREIARRLERYDSLVRESRQLTADKEEAVELLSELADIIEGVNEGVAGCKIDSFTTQPARAFLAKQETSE